MKKHSRLDYTYAVGRVRVLERYLVQRAVFEEAAGEKEYASALKIIFDTGKFSEDMGEIHNSDELDDFLEREDDSLLHVLAELFLEMDILEIVLTLNRPERALEMCRGIRYPFIKDYIRHTIDLANLKFLCRLKYSEAPGEKFERVSLKGGFLDEKILIENFDLEFSEIGEKFRYSPYHQLWDKAVDALQVEETFIRLERGIEDFLMTYLKRAKYIVFGPEPIFAYALARRRELSLVRLVGVGKLNQIPVEILRERISETYV